MSLSTLYVLLIVVCLIKGDELWSWSHETVNTAIKSVMREAFEYKITAGQFGIGDDDSLSMREDPLNQGQYVLSVFYQKGTWSGHRSDNLKCESGQKCFRGAQFYAQPAVMSEVNHTTITLEYEVYFDEMFGWNKGGKLPGLSGGTRDCSGSRISDTCFSTRLMWRADGDGEVYVYVTHKQDPSWTEWCAEYDTNATPSYMHIHCTTSTGIELGKSSFRFQTQTWHKLRQEVHLNIPPERKGYIKLWVDDLFVVNVTDIIMRNNTDFNIDGIFFSTFFGGGDSSWACPNDTYTYYRNFKLSNETTTPTTVTTPPTTVTTPPTTVTTPPTNVTTPPTTATVTESHSLSQHVGYTYYNFCIIAFVYLQFM